VTSFRESHRWPRSLNCYEEIVPVCYMSVLLHLCTFLWDDVETPLSITARACKHFVFGPSARSPQCRASRHRLLFRLCREFPGNRKDAFIVYRHCRDLRAQTPRLCHVRSSNVHAAPLQTFLVKTLEFSSPCAVVNGNPLSTVRRCSSHVSWYVGVRSEGRQSK
jgi:hypothetical protein